MSQSENFPCRKKSPRSLLPSSNLLTRQEMYDCIGNESSQMIVINIGSSMISNRSKSSTIDDLVVIKSTAVL